jgi:biopolymer transport protein ExbB
MSRSLFAVSMALLALLLAGSMTLALAQTPGQTAPAQTAPGQTTPGQTAPGQPATGDTAKADTGAVDSLAAAAKDTTVQAAQVEKPSRFMGGFLSSGFVEWWNKGGRFMWWLLFLSVLGVTLIIERTITLIRAKSDVRRLMNDVVGAIKKGNVDEALEICSKTRGPVPQIIYAGLKQAGKGTEHIQRAIETAGIVEMAFLERGLIIMATVANLAPLVGFLGTVSGMIAAFEAIAQAEQVSAKLVAAGISEALITTLVGLVIAIPVQLAHNLLVQQIDRFVVEMEDSAAELVDALVVTGKA